MKKIIVRIPEPQAGAINPGLPACAISDFIGSVVGLPADLSARKKRYLRATGYGRKRRPRTRQ
jgi:hypothetical protein